MTCAQVTLYLTFRGLREASVEEPMLFAAALLSLANGAAGLAHFVLSPATEPSRRMRDELRVHVYDPADDDDDGGGAADERRHLHSKPARLSLRRGAGGSFRAAPPRPPQRAYPMVLHLGALCYFGCDLALRAVGLCVFVYALGPHAPSLGPAVLGLWLALRLLLWGCRRLPCLGGGSGAAGAAAAAGGGGGVGGGSLAGTNYGYSDGMSFGEALLRDCRRALSPSFVDAAASPRLIAADFLLSTLGGLTLTAIGLLPQPYVPRPHVDPDFRENALTIACAAAVAKYACLAWAVLPGFTLLYPVLGIGRVHTVVEEALAAIRVQRAWRYARAYRLGYHLAAGSHAGEWRRARQQSLALRPHSARSSSRHDAHHRGGGHGGGRGGRRGSDGGEHGSLRALRVIDALRLSERGLGCEDGDCFRRCSRGGGRALGTGAYVLSLGLCCRRFGETDVEGQLEAILEAMDDHDAFDGARHNVGETMAGVFEGRSLARRQKECAHLHAGRFLQWRLRAESRLEKRRRMSSFSIDML